MVFSEFIRKKRRLMGMNQADFAKFIGVYRCTVSNWELGETSPPFEDARRILSLLGATVSITNNKVVMPECPFGYNPYQE